MAFLSNFHIYIAGVVTICMKKLNLHDAVRIFVVPELQGFEISFRKLHL